MKLFRRKKTPPVPARRRVMPAGRTNAYAYYARRSAEPSALGRHVFQQAINVRSAKRTVHYWRQRFGLLVVIIAVIAATVNVLGVSPDPKVLPLDGQKAAFLHPLSTYERAAQTLFDNSAFNHNKITVDTNAISAAMKRQFPELSVVSITLPLVGHRPVMYVSQAEPAAILLAADGSAYVVDVNGRVLGASTAGAAATLHLPLVKDASGSPVRAGRLALSSDTVSFILTVVYQMNHQKRSITSFALPAGTSELDMAVAGKPYLVKFNLANDTALQQVGAYLAVAHQLEEQGITPGSYIDVRVDGRAYYK